MPDAILNAILEASDAYGVQWRQPDLLWGVVLVPVVFLLAGVARATRGRTREIGRAHV